MIWEYFEKYLLNIIKDSMSCNLNIVQNFNNAHQLPQQTVYSFDAYLSSLKAYMYSVEEK